MSTNPALFPQRLSFVAYVHPEPQGSAKAFVIGGKARVTTDNAKLKPFRSEVTRCAMMAMRDTGRELPFAGKHVPVEVAISFYFAKPDSVSKKRTLPSVKPDADKLIRGVFDALSGVAFHDDAQVVVVRARKLYGTPERVEVLVQIQTEQN